MVYGYLRGGQIIHASQRKQKVLLTPTKLFWAERYNFNQQGFALLYCVSILKLSSTHPLNAQNTVADFNKSAVQEKDLPVLHLPGLHLVPFQRFLEVSEMALWASTSVLHPVAQSSVEQSDKQASFQGQVQDLHDRWQPGATPTAR